jgi:hypothetical protein
VRVTLRRMLGETRHDRWCREAGAPVRAIEWRVECWDHWRNVDLPLKKLNLIASKPATNAG